MRFSGPLRAGIICVYFLLFTTKLTTLSVNSNSNNNNRTEDFNSTDSSTLPTTSTRSNDQLLQVVAEGSKMKMKHIHYTTVAYDTLNNIRKQINTTRQQIKNEIPTLQSFYSSVRTALKGVIYNYEWLPKEHLSWYETRIRHLSRRKKLKILIPSLYRSLLNFSATFEELKTYTVLQRADHNSVYLKRMQILNMITGDLNQVISETEHSLYSLRLQHWILKTNASQVIGNSQHWNWNPDRTTIMIQDWGVLTLYYKFLKDWLQILSKHFLYEYRHHRHSRQQQQQQNRATDSRDINFNHNIYNNNNNNNNLNISSINNSNNSSFSHIVHSNTSSCSNNSNSISNNSSSSSGNCCNSSISSDVVAIDNKSSDDDYGDVTSVTPMSSVTISDFTTTFQSPIVDITNTNCSSSL